MPELPEVETTRRGIAPALVGAARASSSIVRERRLRWPIAAKLEAAVRGQHRSRRRAARQIPAHPLRHRHADPASRHVGKPAPGQARHAAQDRTIIGIIRVDSGWVLRFHDPRRFGSLHWTETDPALHPLLAEAGARTLERRVRRRLSVPRDPQAQRRHQATHHEFAARRRRGQHLRQRGLVSRANFAAPRGPPPHPPKRPRLLARPSRRCSARRSRSAARRLRDYVNADGAPGYFRQKLFVYERAGERCRVCKSPVKQFAQGQRSTYWCPTCQR